MEDQYSFENNFRDQILQCSRCGYCQAHCPVYNATLRPALNARGKMLVLKEVMDGKIDLNDELIETLFQCTTCASCFENCPSDVKVPDIIKLARKDMVHMGSCHPAFKGMNKVLQKHTNIYAADEPEDFERERNKKASYVYFIGCVGSFREDESTMATLNLLDRLDVDYTLIDEVCCTGVLEDVGYQLNEDLAQKNIDLILATGAKTVITGCPYCYRTFKNKPQYAELKEKEITPIHITQYLKQFNFGANTEKRVTYHDPCDLGRHCEIYEEPREIIKNFAPNFIEMPNHHADSLCCGAGGGVRGAYAKNSLAMARRRVLEALSIGADVLLTECNSCVHNLGQAKLRKENLEIRTISGFVNELMASGF